MLRMMIYKGANDVLGSSLTPRNRCICKKTALQNGADPAGIIKYIPNVGGSGSSSSSSSSVDPFANVANDIYDANQLENGVYVYLNNGKLMRTIPFKTAIYSKTLDKSAVYGVAVIKDSTKLVIDLNAAVVTNASAWISQRFGGSGRMPTPNDWLVLNTEISTYNSEDGVVTYADKVQDILDFIGEDPLWMDPNNNIGNIFGRYRCSTGSLVSTMYNGGGTETGEHGLRFYVSDDFTSGYQDYCRAFASIGVTRETPSSTSDVQADDNQNNRLVPAQAIQKKSQEQSSGTHKVIFVDRRNDEYYIIHTDVVSDGSTLQLINDPTGGIGNLGDFFDCWYCPAITKVISYPNGSVIYGTGHSTFIESINGSDADYAPSYAFPASDFVVDKDLVLYAYYSSYVNPGKRYNIKFVDEDGTILKSQRVKEGSMPSAPTPPEKDGYSFAGWEDENGDMGVKAATEDMIYTATYSQGGSSGGGGEVDPSTPAGSLGKYGFGTDVDGESKGQFLRIDGIGIYNYGNVVLNVTLRKYENESVVSTTTGTITLNNWRSSIQPSITISSSLQNAGLVDLGTTTTSGQAIVEIGSSDRVYESTTKLEGPPRGTHYVMDISTDNSITYSREQSYSIEGKGTVNYYSRLHIPRA